MLIRSKKLGLICVLCLIACLVLSACSGGGTGKEEPPKTPETSKGSTQSTAGNDKKTGEQAGGSVPSVQISTTNDKGQSAKLPDAYPKAVLPLYDDSFIVSCIESNGGFTITAFSSTDFDKVEAFYKEALKKATVTAETSEEDSFTSFGTIDKYTYNFSVGVSDEMDGYVTSIIFLLFPTP